MNDTMPDTLSGRCAKFLLDNSLTCITEHGVQVVLPVTSAILCELVDLVRREKGEL